MRQIHTVPRSDEFEGQGKFWRPATACFLCLEKHLCSSFLWYCLRLGALDQRGFAEPTEPTVFTSLADADAFVTSSPLGVRSIAMRVAVRLSVYLSVNSHFSKATRPNFTKFSVHVACGRGLVLH